MAAEKHPHRVKQLLAYQATILREARRCGGNGWRAYDAMFRQLAATDDTIDWSRLNPSLYATTFMVQQGGGSRICHLCMGADHVQDDCALAPLQTNAQSQQTPGTSDLSDTQGIGNRQETPAPAGNPTRPAICGTTGGVSTRTAVTGMCACAVGGTTERRAAHFSRPDRPFVHQGLPGVAPLYRLTAWRDF